MNRINGTRFLKQEELALQLTEIDWKQEHYPVGGVPLLVKDNKVYVDGTDSHTIIFGATGSKKTRMFAMPSIGIFSRAGESFVVTDPKGELYDKTAGEVVERGYQVCRLNLRKLREGGTWNPLVLPYEYYHKGKKSKSVEMVNEFASMIIGQDSSEEQFWVNTGIGVLVGFIVLLFESATKEECNLKSLIELWNKYINNRKRFLGMVADNYKDTIVYQKLSVLDNPTSLFLEQLYEVLIQAAQSREDNQLPIRMNFLIDEFANIPRLENMDAMISAARSRNIRFHLIVQSMKQLRQKYKENAAVICSNCNNWVYLYSKEYELLQEISRLCGEVIYDNNMRMPLFSEFDLQHLDKEKGEALILAGRNYPCIVNLADINAYPYEEKMPAHEIKQEWLPVSVHQFKEQRKSQYVLPLTSSVMWECEDSRYAEEKRWLVAVGPKGMIVAEKIVDARDITNGVAIMGMMYDIRYKQKLEANRLHWYSADEEMEEKYRFMLRTYPEMVYATMEELGRERFRKENYRASQEYPFEAYTDQTYIVQGGECGNRRKRNVFVTSEDKKLKIEEKIECYGGMIGEYYALNVFFRRANNWLKDTRFAECSWVQYWDEYCREELPTFQKRINPDDYVSVNFYLKHNE